MDALYAAIKTDDSVGVIKSLTAFKAKEMSPSSLKLALDLAVIYDNEVIISTLIGQTVHVWFDEDLFFQDALTTAIKNCSLKSVQLLVAAGADPFQGGLSDAGVHLAAQQENTGVLQYFLDLPSTDNRFAYTRRHFRDTHGDTPLHNAVCAHNIGSVKLLLSRGAFVNAPDNFGCTPLHQFSKFPCSSATIASDMVQTLVNAGAGLSSSGFAYHYKNMKTVPLLEAAASGSAETVRALLKVKADKHVQEPNTQMQAIHFAAGSGSVDTVKVLLEADASVSAVDKFSNTPLHILGIHRHRGNARAVVAYLIRQGADINARNAYGITPVHYACGSQRGKRFEIDDADVDEEEADEACISLLEVLLEHGADPNAVSKKRNSPMHFLMYELSRNIRAVPLPHSPEAIKPAVEFISRALKKLKAAGSHANVMNNRGITPMRLLVDLLGPSSLKTYRKELSPVFAALLSAGDFCWDLIPIPASPGLSAAFYSIYNDNPAQIPYLIMRLPREEKQWIRFVVSCLHRRLPQNSEIIMRIMSYALEN